MTRSTTNLTCLIYRCDLRYKEKPTWASSPEETSKSMAVEKASPVTLPEWPLSLLLTCVNKKQPPCLWKSLQNILLQTTIYFSLKGEKHASVKRTWYINIVESSIPIATMLLSWGWKAILVAAGDGDIKEIILCSRKDPDYLADCNFFLISRN